MVWATDRIHLAFAFNDGRIQRGRKGLRVDGGRHQDNPEVFPKERLGLAHKGQRLVALEAPLVKLVEDDGRNSFEGRVFDEHPRKDPLREHLDAGFPGHLAFEADAVSHGLSYRLPEEPGHPLGNLPGRHPAGLQHKDFPLRKRLQDGQGQYGRFTRSGRGRHHKACPLGQDTVNLFRYAGGRKGRYARVTEDTHQCKGTQIHRLSVYLLNSPPETHTRAVHTGYVPLSNFFRKLAAEYQS